MQLRLLIERNPTINKKQRGVLKQDFHCYNGDIFYYFI